MNTTTRTAAPAPLPYASQAGRGEIPPTTPAKPTDPDGPILREDEVTLWLCIGIVVLYVVLMTIVAALGGL